MSCPSVSSIHETEIKMVKSKWSYKKFIAEIQNRKELRGSKGITRVETDYESQKELRGSKQITSHKLREYKRIRELLYYIYLNIIYVHITN